MRKSRFTEAQIIALITEQEAGMPTAEACRGHGLSTATFYKLEAKYGGMDVSEATRLKALEDENAKLMPGRSSGAGLSYGPGMNGSSRCASVGWASASER